MNFWLFSLVKFSYWSKFHVKITTGSGTMTTLSYNGLTRNLEIENTPSGFCPISEDCGKLGIPNLARMSLTTCFLIASKSQGYSFYRFWVIKRKPTGDGQGVGANYTIPRFLLKSNYITINTLHPRNLWLKSNDLTIITLTPYNIK